MGTLRSEHSEGIRKEIGIDPGKETEKICDFIRSSVLERQGRRGVVLGLSGGIDSTVCAYLAVKALGPERVLGLKMPERESEPDSSSLADTVVEALGIEALNEDITGILDGAGCYSRRDEAIRRMVPGYGPGWRSKLVLPSIIDNDRFNVSRLIVESPEGIRSVHRPNYRTYFEIVSASNFKQRARKMIEYHHADRLNYSVLGTPNLLEYQLGFFVKNGDGASDIKPIAHLYKTQVYAIGGHLGVPGAILGRPPTTDTYSLPQTQDEFFFSLPYEKMDIALYALNKGYGPQDTNVELGLTVEQTVRVFNDIRSKMKATRYLHMAPAIMDGGLDPIDRQGPEGK